MKRIFNLRPALLLPALLCGFGAMAQQTGSFNTNITFMGAQRQLACYVPTDYDPAVPMKLMIGLHGLGDVANPYRTALVSSLGFATAVPNTILVCPDGGSDPNSDFYTPVGDEAIIAESIAFARANYNIDTTEIVLQGFSLGGRSALRYGLQHTNEFKGLLLTTPAVQGVKEAVRQFADGGMYDYDAAPQIPIYVTHGNTDDLYHAPIDSTCEQLVRHDAAFKLFRFNGGHTIPNFSQIQDFNAFFEASQHAGEDVRVAKVTVAPRSCNTSVPAKVLIQNTGTTPLTSVGLRYDWNNSPQHYTWNGTLTPKGHTEVSLPAFTAAENDYTLEVTADTLNGTVLDTVVANNGADAGFRITPTATDLPYNEPFSNADFMDKWVIQPSGDYILPWTYDDEVFSLFCINSIFIFDNSSRREELLSPVMDLTSLSNPFVAFDVAFNYTSYTASFLGMDATFSDTLEVLVSTDCGETFQSVYRKAGAELATYPNPIVNPNGLEACFIDPQEGDWRRDRIDLSAFASSTDAVVKFSYISGLGGCIALDNVSFVNEETGIKELPVAQVSIYPNPVQYECKVTTGNSVIETVTVCDISGKAISSLQGKGQKEMMVPVASLPDGVYLLNITTANGRVNKKIVVQH